MPTVWAAVAVALADPPGTAYDFSFVGSLGDGNSSAAWKLLLVFIVALRLPDAIYRNICVRLSSGSAFAFAPPQRQLYSITCLAGCLPAQDPQDSRTPGSPAPDCSPHRFTSTTLADFLNELSSPLSYEINDFSANFQQFAFWPRPGTKMGMVKGAGSSKSKAKTFSD